MNRVKLYICTKNQEYGEKLSRFLAEQHSACLEVELLTELGDRTDVEPDAYVVSDDERVWEEPGLSLVRLVRMPEETGERDIFMYQSAREIYRQLLRLTGVKERGEASDGEPAVPKVVCVFSACESDQNAVFALRTAADRLERGSVLYVSLSGMPLFFGEAAEVLFSGGGLGISELMLCSDRDIFEEKLSEMPAPAGKLSALVPAEHFRDLLDFTSEEAARFVDHLKRQTLFDSVVIEVGQLYEFTFSLLAGSDAVLVPREQGVLAEERRRVLRKCCEREGDLWERFVFVPVSPSQPNTWEEVRQIVY